MKNKTEKAAVIHQNATNKLFSLTVCNLTGSEKVELLAYLKQRLEGMEVFNHSWLGGVNDPKRK
jgi:hypothetical protein